MLSSFERARVFQENYHGNPIMKTPKKSQKNVKIKDLPAGKKAKSVKGGDESPKETVTFEYGGLAIRYSQQRP